MRLAAQQLVDRADANAKAARADLLATVSELRLRLDPRVIAAEGMETLVDRTHDATRRTSDAARANPIMTAGGLAAVLAAIGLRIWLVRRAKSQAAETSATTSVKDPNSTSRV